MNGDDLSNLIVAAITAVATIASQYGLKKIKQKQTNLELDKQQKEHTDSLYTKVIELQRDSISYLDDANRRISALSTENIELKNKVEQLEDIINNLKEKND